MERYRVSGAGLSVVALAAGDRLEVIDPEGRQAAELLAFDVHGREAIAALGLCASPGAQAIARLLQGGDASLQPRRARQQRRASTCRPCQKRVNTGAPMHQPASGTALWRLAKCW